MCELLFYSPDDHPEKVNAQAARMTSDFILCAETCDPQTVAGELTFVLSLSPLYAVVSPRMQDGSFLSLPSSWKGEQLSNEQLESLRDAAVQYLPASSPIPYGGADCCLIRQSIAQEFGFLDPAFQTVREALIDYCIRLRKAGYCAVAAHHAFLPLPGPIKRSPSDHTLLTQRYPDWMQAQADYLKNGQHACDYFLTVLAGRFYPKQRLMLNYVNMPAAISGGVQVRLSVLEYLCKHCSDQYEIFVCAPREAVSYHHLDSLPVQIVDPDRIDGVYHLSYCSTQPFYMGAQYTIMRHCLKNVFTVLDVILCRCDYLQGKRILRDEITRQNIEYSDGLLFISQFSKDDYDVYFPDDFGIMHSKCQVVHLSSAFQAPSKAQKHQLPFLQYTLIPGSRYEHKGLRDTLKTISATKRNYIMIGLPEEGLIEPNVYNYPGGNLGEELMQTLYQSCDQVISPSYYEGFGLPVLQGVQCGKRLVVMDTAVNRELVQRFAGLKDYVCFMRRFAELPAILDAMENLPSMPPLDIHYTNMDYAKETVDFLEDVLSEAVDAAELQNKWHIAAVLQT